MKIEYEAKFIDIDKASARRLLKNIGAQLVRKEFMQKRMVFDLPKGTNVSGGFVRVRDEGDKVTLTLKVIKGTKISDQQETQVTVDDFDSTVAILSTIGCVQSSYEETKRELWTLGGVEITIDDWPFLGTIMEIEGTSEKKVRDIVKKLGFDWSLAKFGPAGHLYRDKYGYGPMDLYRKTGKVTQLVFKGKNPFL